VPARQKEREREREREREIEAYGGFSGRFGRLLLGHLLLFIAGLLPLFAYGDCKIQYPLCNKLRAMIHHHLKYVFFLPLCLGGKIILHVKIENKTQKVVDDHFAT
jgi:hypothetical protein